MFLQPKKTKYKKTKKGKLNSLEYKTNKLQFGTVGLKAVNSAIVTARQIEASRQAISRKIKKKGKLWGIEVYYISYIYNVIMRGGRLVTDPFKKSRNHILNIKC